GGVVDQALRLQQRHHPPRSADIPQQCSRGQRVRRGEQGPERECHGPTDLRQQRMGDDADQNRRSQDQANSQRQNRSQLSFDVARRGVEAGDIDQRRQEQQEDQFGRQLDVRRRRQDRQQQTAKDEQDRIRDG